MHPSRASALPQHSSGEYASQNVPPPLVKAWNRQAMGSILSPGAGAGVWIKTEDAWESTAEVSLQEPPVEDAVVQRCRGQVYVGGTGQLRKEDIEGHLTAHFGLVDVSVTPAPTRWGHGFAFASFANLTEAHACLRSGGGWIEGQWVKFGLTSSDQKGLGTVSEESLAGFNDTGVFLGGTRQLREDQVFRALSFYGEVVSLNLVSKPGDLFTPAGFGFAKFASVGEAKRLLLHGEVLVEGVRIEARRADVRPSLSDKVSMAEAEELIASLEAEIEQTREFAPGGYVLDPGARNEGIVLWEGTRFECVFDQVIEERKVPLSRDGYSLDDLQQALKDALALRIKVWDCLNARARQAAISGNTTALLELVRLGADTDAPERATAMHGVHSFGTYDPLSPRCLYLAAARGHADVCRLLCELGAEVDQVCVNDELQALFEFVEFTPLKAAAERGHLEAVKVLLQCGASPNALDQRNWTVMHWAACNDHVEVVREVAAAGGEVGARDSKGNTVLHLAVSAGAVRAAVALVELLDADPHALNNKGVSPLPELRRLLLPHGGAGAANETAAAGPHQARGPGGVQEEGGGEEDEEDEGVASIVALGLSRGISRG